MSDHKNLSFSPEMEEKILDGYKVMTSRRLPYPIGYTFTIRGKAFRVIAAFFSRYHVIRDCFFYSEGFCSPGELEDFFEEIGYSTLNGDIYCCMIFEPVGIWGDK